MALPPGNPVNVDKSNPNNPNNTATWTRRGGQTRELDNDGNCNAAADFDRAKQMKDFARHDDMAAYPTRDTTAPKQR